MRFVFLGCFFGLLFAAGGCGGTPSGTVSGKVYYKGEPLKGGRVTFEPESKKTTPQTAEIDEQGNYKIEKLATGDSTITVDTAYLKPSLLPSAAKGKMKAPAGAPSGDRNMPLDPEERAKRYVKIPEKYSNPKGSGLKYNVKPGSQPYDIKLEE